MLVVLMHVTRRETLAAVGIAAAGGLAGCSGVTQRSFAATPVVLSGPAREELVLAETLRESQEVTREGPSGNVEVSITSEAGGYRRGPVRGTPTILERYTRRINQTPGSGVAINAIASNLGITEISVPGMGISISGDQFSIVVPEGARADTEVDPGKTLAVIPGVAMDQNSGEYSGDAPGAFVSGEDLFPCCTLIPSQPIFPSGLYFPSGSFFPDTRSPDTLSEFRGFVPNVESFMNRAGIDELPESAQRVEPGETIETAETVIVSPLADFDNPHDLPPASQLFDTGAMLPMGGTPFGLGVFATPTASIGGQEVSTLVGMDTKQLLSQEAIGRLLGQSGIVSVDSVEWLIEPSPTDFTLSQPGFELLGQDAELQSFTGVLSGEDGAWGVLLAVSRITDSDHIVAASGISRPVGTPDGGAELGVSGWGTAELLNRILQGTAITMSRLERV